jgi:hypothetical protein
LHLARYPDVRAFLVVALHFSYLRRDGFTRYASLERP